MDYKAKIIEELDIMMRKYRKDNDRFRVIAYSRVLKQLREKEGAIRSFEDLKDIEGIGSGIRDKINEIFETGVLKVAEDIKSEEVAKISVFDQLLRIHGIGAVKARNLIDKYKIESISDLREKSETDPKILNKQQKIGLKYFEEIEERIPRSEMRQHEKLLVKKLKGAIIVGSYRRGLKDSGDIDVLVSEKDVRNLEEIVEDLKKSGYITDILALGEHKCMAIATLGVKHRRLDILITPEREFATSVLYFTGSQKFNIEMRKIALKKGYSLSEHGLAVKNEGVEDPPIFKTEKDIFDFLGMEYVEPSKRL